MRKVWTRKRDPVDAALRSERPEASDDLVATLAGRVDAAMSAPVRRWSRTAFALSLSVFMLGTFASFGGLGYAASSAQSTAKVVKRIVVPDKKQKNLKARSTKSAAAAQYGHEDVEVPAAAKKPTVKPKPKKKPPVVQVAGATAGSPAAAQGELPFTGLGLGATAAFGTLLLGLGLFLRRREAARE